MKLRLFDAHCHLQEERLLPHIASIMEVLEKEGVARLVVDGSCESDWADVLALAQKYPQVLPSFGYHPWYVGERTAQWRENLLRYLDQIPSAIGEIGLDRWIENYDIAAQEEVFLWQMQVAAERNLPVSIHCLKAWGKLHELLRAGPRPRRGFLLHSYGGPQEMIQPLAELGAYFSISGYFAHERKVRQRETFRHVPRDRLLIETDAPDMLPPQERIAYPLGTNDHKAPNHPGNLRKIYEFVAELRGEVVETLAQSVEQNFQGLFGGISH